MKPFLRQCSSVLSDVAIPAPAGLTVEMMKRSAKFTSRIVSSQMGGLQNINQ
jgi:hypothetical protein